MLWGSGDVRGASTEAALPHTGARDLCSESMPGLALPPPLLLPPPPPPLTAPPQVRTLQLEVEYVAGALEDEALDIVGGGKPSDLSLSLSRRGSSDEVALLVAGGGSTGAVEGGGRCFPWSVLEVLADACCRAITPCPPYSYSFVPRTSPTALVPSPTPLQSSACWTSSWRAWRRRPTPARRC